MNNPNQSKPTVGFAFSGASSRSVFYIGFLEVLKENGFPIDYIAAMSGGAVVAASFACGTLPALKEMALAMDKELIFNLIERSKSRGGMYTLQKVESVLRVYSKNLKFEDVSPRLGFVTTDVSAHNPENIEVVLQVGDIAKAVCASCTLPGVFEPYEWGSKQLLDGGIVNIVPGNVARAANMDIVIGIDMRATRHIFSTWQIVLKKSLDLIKRILWPSKLDQLWRNFKGVLNYDASIGAYQTVDHLQDKSAYPGIFSVLDKAIGLAIQAQKKHQADNNFDCDIIISPDVAPPSFWKRYLYLHFTDFSSTQEYYKAGRRVALQKLPELWQLLADKEVELSQKTAQVKNLLEINVNE
ncbi:MAG TPA: patatin-like phospholipase family protein [Patescibacteria group bacterium]|jgi:NTE family protein|nr:patatin-like phospholipase family protein [Patescibacteria group bacterium]